MSPDKGDSMDLGIAGKCALVTASSKGLGRACAEALAAEGCRVVVSSRGGAALEETAAAIRKAGAEVEAIVADVSKSDDLERLVERAAERFGGVDILVTNTGGPVPGTFTTTEEPAWVQGFENTLMNVVRLARHCLPHMRSNKWGRIVNITSVSVKQPIANLLISNSLRAAVHGLSKTMATEFAGDGVLVNCVCPGLHLTDRLRELAEVRGEANGRTAEKELEVMTGSVPVGHLGRPGDFASVVAFLCSERAGFVTGTSVLVDGGATLGVT
ncbi:MAG: SDR family oxidoreductase [Phycisphaerales bacterium]|nr:SDR family oxidoreductase [Phycisphaerales bacterium]